MEEIKIRDEFIKLGQLLKLADMVQDGVEAKYDEAVRHVGRRHGQYGKPDGEHDGGDGRRDQPVLHDDEHGPAGK